MKNGDIFNATIEHLSAKLKANNMKGNIILEQKIDEHGVADILPGSLFEQYSPIIITAFGIKDKEDLPIFSLYKSIQHSIEWLENALYALINLKKQN